MSKILLYIKKFFAMLVSIIYGAIKQRVDYKDEVQTVEDNEEETVAKKKDVATRIFHDDSPSEKARTSYSKNKSDEEDIIYNAKRDIQKLIFIQKNITKIEEQIDKCEDIEEMYLLEAEWKRAKFHFDKIAKQYEKIDLDEKIIVDIKRVIKDTKKMVDFQEKTIDKKIYKLKQEKQPEEEKSETIEKPKIGIVEEQKKEKEELKKKEEQREEKQKTEDKTEEVKLSKEEQIEKIEEEIEVKELEEIIPEEEKKVEEEKEIKKRIVPVDIENVKKNTETLKENRNSRNLIAITAILAQARALAASTNISTLLQLNPTIAISSTLHINNEVRRARNYTGAKVKNLNLDKVVKAVGLNPQLQARYIVANSLKEIRKLKNELRQCGNIPEAVNALNELDELEMELLMQINELQMQNQNQQNRHR